MKGRVSRIWQSARQIARDEYRYLAIRSNRFTSYCTKHEEISLWKKRFTLHFDPEKDLLEPIKRTLI